MSITYITHYDKTYFSQAKTMRDSLRQFDESSDILSIPLEPGVESIDKFNNCFYLDWIEEESKIPIQEIKSNRTWKEFCWTLEPILVHYALSHLLKDDDLLVYVDADSYFFGDPLPAIELGNAEIGLTTHRFPPSQKYREDSVGKFNFGFGIFRNTSNVREAVIDWMDHTIAGDNYKVGGQKYLDKWPYKFGTDFIELDAGYNVGPWQLMNAHVNEEVGTCIWSSAETLKNISQLISYHFHEFRRGTGKNPIYLNAEEWNRTNYKLTPSAIRHIYLPYEEALQKHL